MQSGEYWIGIGDLHDDTTTAKRIPGIREASGIIVSGDLTVGGSIKQAERVLEPLAGLNAFIFAQIGNMDRGEVTGYLAERGWNIHATGRQIAPDVGLFGVGTSTFTPFGTPSEFPESRIGEWLEQAFNTVRTLRRRILVSHTPPFNTTCDRIGAGVHVGSSAVREFIEEHQPDICLCGHIHEARGTDMLGRTLVINTGPLASGSYALIRNTEEGLKAELRQIA